MRVVLDTNVLVSAFLSPSGPPSQIFQQWEEGAFDLIVSEALLTEYDRVLSYPHLASRHGLTPREINGAVAAIREFALIVEPRDELSVITADPSDNRVLECALAGEAEYIVSGDARHLLPLQEFHGIVILSPTAYGLSLERAAPDPILHRWHGYAKLFGSLTGAEPATGWTG